MAEDDQVVRALVGTILRRDHYQVEFAKDGIEALEKLEVNHYELILLDLMMPRLSGFQVIAQISTHDPDHLSRIVVMTATTEKEYAHLDREKLCGLIRKPFDVHQFSLYIAERIEALGQASASSFKPL